jgi:hypothetical protein
MPTPTVLSRLRGSLQHGWAAPSVPRLKAEAHAGQAEVLRTRLQIERLKMLLNGFSIGGPCF